MVVSLTLVEMANLQTQPMSQGISVGLPNGEKVLCTKIAKGCPLEIDIVTLEANLIVFGTLGFDVILGMDWLFMNFTSIDCWSRMVTFQVPRLETRIFKGSELCSMPEVITALQVKKSW